MVPSTTCCYCTPEKGVSSISWFMGSMAMALADAREGRSCMIDAPRLASRRTAPVHDLSVLSFVTFSPSPAVSFSSISPTSKLSGTVSMSAHCTTHNCILPPSSVPPLPPPPTCVRGRFSLGESPSRSIGFPPMMIEVESCSSIEFRRPEGNEIDLPSRQ